MSMCRQVLLKLSCLSLVFLFYLNEGRTGCYVIHTCLSMLISQSDFGERTFTFTLFTAKDLGATERKPDLVSKKRCFEMVGGTELSVVVEGCSTA